MRRSPPVPVNCDPLDYPASAFGRGALPARLRAVTALSSGLLWHETCRDQNSRASAGRRIALKEDENEHATRISR
jgi:hypothetical protein